MGGGALMFVPSLPLMQSEVRRHGDQVVEQVAELFVTMMTLGELTGPIFGGMLVGHVGFVWGTFVLALLCLPLFFLALMSYDREAARERRDSNFSTPLIGHAVESPFDDARCGPRCMGAMP